MTKENENKIVVVESRLGFLRGGAMPDFLKDPIERIVRFIGNLPFLTEEQKRDFLKRIESLRAEENKKEED